jgi:adenylosuccinate synthase
MAYSLTLILLSGPIASGKTTLARHLGQLVHAEHITTSHLISAAVGRDLDRNELQRQGSAARFQGADWIISAVRQTTNRAPAGTVIVVDAVRTLEQVTEFRKAAAGTWRILHMHLCGEDPQFAGRHKALGQDLDGAWDEMMKSPTEAAVHALEAEADVVIDTTRTVPADVAVRAAARIRRAQLPGGRYVDVLVGGQWGSEGKGNLAFFIAPEYDLLVRVGAPNAGHKVRGQDGVVYTHRQLPSGTRATDSLLLLGAGTVLDVGILRREIADCEISADRLAIDPGALIIEEGDVPREAGLKNAIGSTGTGGGAALARRIMQRGVPGAVRMAKDIPELSPYIRESGS